MKSLKGSIADLYAHGTDLTKAIDESAEADSKAKDGWADIFKKPSNVGETSSPRLARKS